ncbi:MAG: haloalkane dehalogenase [Pseudomonadota bacterium]
MLLSIRLALITALCAPVPAIAQGTADKAFADLPEARLAYVETGAPDGRPVLFVHGLPFSSFIWRDVAAALAEDAATEGLRLIAVDLAGFGDSEAGPGLYGVDDQARHLGAFADALELSDVTIVAHDWGAGIALMYAAQNPEDVSSFAFFEGSMPPVYPRPAYEELPERVAGMFRSMREEEAEANVLDGNLWLDTIMPTMTAEPLPPAVRAEYDRPFPTPESRLPLLEMSRSLPIGGEPAGATADYAAAVDWWTTTEIPKLVLYAEPGRLYPEQFARWNEENAANVTLGSVGVGLHAWQEDDPQALAEALAAWIGALD